jgi:3-deoxy-D-manno-octulosonate 8-phosphate phosphatase (KDO 8-P phosphatase)
MDNVEDIFMEQGGTFISPPADLIEKLKKVKSFIFDWDGVFNDGYKNDNQGSPFSEADSMGINMLRFSYYLKNSNIPKLFIITGENNLPAVSLSKREKFNGVYMRVKNKLDSLRHINDNFGVAPEQVAFSFDDILDLGLARQVALRFMVRRSASPMLTAMVVKNGWTDYLTANTGGQHAVREIAELMIGLNGNYEAVIEHRVGFSDTYQNYLQERNSISPSFFTGETGRMTPLGIE